jgi:subtilisin family serine protease
MPRARHVWAGLVVLLCACAALPGLVLADWDYTRVQVKLTPGTQIEEVNAVYGTVTLDTLPPIYLLQVPNGYDVEVLLALMQNDHARFIWAEHAYLGETPEGVRQMVVAIVGDTITGYWDQHVAARLHLPEIHERTTGQGITVAVLDTGVDANHEALFGVVRNDGWDFIDNDCHPDDIANGIDDDGDGLVDEGAGHGTMVAGIVHLVAPGAAILPIRVLDDEGHGTTFSVAKGIRYAVQHGASVINMSFGLTERCNVINEEMEAAQEASVALIAAAGNSGLDSLLLFPASDPKALMVAALDSNDVKADFSSYDAKVAVSAPGVGILAPFYNGGYALGAGTSFSTPFISGQCALILDLDPTLSFDQLYQHVQRGVVDIYRIPGNGLYDGKLGTGRIDGVSTMLEGQNAANVRDSRGPAGEITIAPNPVPAGRPVRILWGAARPGGRAAAAGGSNATGGAPAIQPASMRSWNGSIVDAQGRLVRTLGFRAGAGAPGWTEWDGRDQSGHGVGTGVYFVRLLGPAGTRTGRLVVIR